MSSAKQGGTKPSGKPLSAKQAKFAAEYLIDLNATQAALRAGYSQKAAQVTGSRLLSNAMVAAAIQEGRHHLAKELHFDAAAVLREWITIATADPAELTQWRQGSCKRCWFDKDGNPNPGAEDKSLLSDPNPECRFCRGEGYGRVFLKDSRLLTPSARKLFAGVKQTKDGVEVKMRDQDGALTNIARHLGMYNDKLELKGGINVTISQDDGNL